MGTAIKHPVPDLVKPSVVILTSGHSEVQCSASEWLDVKNYNDGLTQSGTHMPQMQQRASKG